MNPCSCSTCAALLTHIAWISRVTHQLTSTHRENTAQANFKPNQTKRAPAQKPNQHQIQQWFVLIPICSALNWCKVRKLHLNKYPSCTDTFTGLNTPNQMYKSDTWLNTHSKLPCSDAKTNGSFVHHVYKECGQSHSTQKKNSTDKQMCMRTVSYINESRATGAATTWTTEITFGLQPKKVIHKRGHSQQNIWITAEVFDAWLMKTENYLMSSRWKLSASGLPLTAWWSCARAAQTRSSFPSLQSLSAPRLKWKTPAESLILSDNLVGLAESHKANYSFKHALYGYITLMEFLKTVMKLCWLWHNYL